MHAGSGGKPTRDWPEYIGSERKRYPTIAFDGGYGSGVRDVSWGNTWVQSLPQARTNGALSQTGLCSKIPVKVGTDNLA